jgi:hypothetical protein
VIPSGLLIKTFHTQQGYSFSCSPHAWYYEWNLYISQWKIKVMIKIATNIWDDLEWPLVLNFYQSLMKIFGERGRMMKSRGSIKIIVSFKLRSISILEGVKASSFEKLYILSTIYSNYFLSYTFHNSLQLFVSVKFM